MIRAKQERVDITFAKNINLLYPHINGMRKKTEKLNEVLEQILFGKKK